MIECFHTSEGRVHLKLRLDGPAGVATVGVDLDVEEAEHLANDLAESIGPAKFYARRHAQKDSDQ